MATQTQPVTFIAASKNLRIVHTPETFDLNHAGTRVATYPGIAIQFEDNKATISEGPDGKALVNGKPIGNITAVELIEWLRSRPNINRPQHGFYEIGAAPDEQRPTIAEQMRAIGRAEASGDLPALVALLEGEQDTHGRPDVLNAVQGAIDALSGEDASADDVDVPEWVGGSEG